MKKILIAFAALIALAACNSKQAAAPEAENGFEVAAFDPVEDGSQYLPTAQKIFGDKFDAFQALHSNDGKRESLRAGALADYVRKHGLKATLYQDFGWPAKELK